MTLSLTALAAAVVPAAAAVSATRGIPGYGYELASPPSTAGQDPNPLAIGDSGEDVLFRSSGGFADVGNLMPLGHLYRAKRTASGGVTESAGLPPAAAFPGGVAIGDWQANWWQVDRPLLLAAGSPRYDPDGTDNGNRVLVGTKGGGWNQVSPVKEADDADWATAEDLSGVLLSTKQRLALTDGTVDTRSANLRSLVVSRRLGDGSLDLRQIARQGGATMLPTCEIQPGSPANGVKRGAVDRDGLRRVIWTTLGTGCTTAARQRVYVTEPFSSTPDAVDVSASRCTGTVQPCGTAQTVRFAGASLDTERIFMTTTQKLLDADGNTTSDIYEYDFRRPDVDRLRLVTGDAAPANVLGIVTVSDTGSHMYFVARGALSDAVVGDTAPVAGAPNLYVRIAPLSGGPAVTRFLATLDEADAGLWGSNARPAEATPDGRYLVVTSRAALTDDKQPGDTLPDVYRVDSSTGRIERAWVTEPAHNGASRSEGSVGPTNSFAHVSTANFESGQRSPSIAADGSAIIFASKEPLVAGDDNANLDVFVWTASDGAVSMISDGHDPQGITLANVRVTPDGRSFTFMTRSQLVPQHTATSLGLYVYRQGGGFPVPEDPPAPCAGEACQGRVASPPVVSQIGSIAIGGDGNLPWVPEPVKAAVGVARMKAVTGSAARLKVRVTGAGRISVAGSSIRRTGVSASKAGAYTVKVVLSAKAKKALRQRKTLKVSARVSFRARDGRSVSKTVAVTFKQPKAKRAKAEKGGR